MTTITQEIRAQVRELGAKADAIYQAATPLRQALDEAMKPWREIEDQIYDLSGDAEVEWCSTCGEPIFEGDAYSVTTEGEKLCVKCSPTYQDMLDDPGYFANDEGDPMTAAEAKEVCDAHVAAGGALSDKIAVRLRTFGALQENQP